MCAEDGIIGALSHSIITAKKVGQPAENEFILNFD